MKKIAAFSFLLMAASGPLAAQENNRSALRVRMTDNRPLTLVIDGRHFQRYGNVLTVGDLPPGRHDIRVYYYYPATAGNGYKGYRAKAQLVYSGTMRLEPSSMYYCTVDGDYGKMQVRQSHVVSLNDGERNYPIDNDEEFTDPTVRHGYKLEEPKPKAEDPARSGALSYNNDFNLLSQQQLDELKQKADEQLVDADKIKLMEAYLKGRSFSTAQVGVMMNWLNFETARLDFAKWCYGKVSDSEHFLQLKDQFTFQDNKTELERYVFKQ
jgi:hypothetical protein